MGHDLPYVGEELRLFARATNWKRYLAAVVAPYLGPEVLEVGAGIGATTRAFCDGTSGRWVCLEPDHRMALELGEALRQSRLPPCCEARHGTIADLAPRETFDTILYIDVLEHIEQAADELRMAGRHLRPGGHLVVLCPAHQWLYSPFDRAVGHVRRYTRARLLSMGPPGLPSVFDGYLDSAGLVASLANRFFLRQAVPTEAQIAFWDRRLVPVSRALDPRCGFRAGKSVLVVWQQPPQRMT